MTATKEAGGKTRREGRPGLVLTAVGPDRPGLVKDIAGHVRKLGGNIEDTRMSKLGGEFAVLILVTGEEMALSALRESLPQMEAGFGVACFVKNTASTPRDESQTPFSFDASGFDHPGIVEGVTEVLAGRNVNVTSFTSYIENAPLSGTPLFHLKAEIEVPPGTNVDDLRAHLSEACEKQGLEFTLSPLAR